MPGGRDGGEYELVHFVPLPFWVVAAPWFGVCVFDRSPAKEPRVEALLL
jgi:hypothetical protein